MLRRFSIDFAIFSMFFDCLLVAIALGLAILVRPLLSFLPFAVDFKGPFNIPSSLYPTFSISWMLILVLFSVYDTRRNFRAIDELTSLTFGSLLAGVALAGLLYLTYRDISRALYLFFVALAYLLLVSYRLAYRLSFRVGWLKSIQQRKVLIIGHGPVGTVIEKHLDEQKELGLQLVGYLDDNLEKKELHPDILGKVDDARSVIIKDHIDDVVLALPRRAYERTNQLVSALSDLPIKIWVIPDYFTLVLSRASVEEFAGMPLIDLRAPSLSDYQRLIKRIFDICISIFLIPFVLPPMAIIALAIRLDSPGPIIFKQKRVGENGCMFGMYKFRSMITEAESMRHLIEKRDAQGNIIQNKSIQDPRITRVGRFIRNLSLDELPQIFNVLNGDMSIVGPRPELPYMVECYEPWQRKRFTVPQGITGWWQVNGRSDKPMYQNTEDDLYYIQHYSFWLDIWILVKTVGAVINRKGAY
ncbi:MAG: sugar transferase [Anaerolineaceae bacterium]|nr:sugar transferase [Anaerolineaceae bacterium]